MTPEPLNMKVTPVAAPLRQQLIETLRRSILEFHFKPGDRLVERELCELTGVSRTSLREALRQLESEGLVTIIPNRGPVVATVDRDEAKEIYDLRLVLEGYMGRCFAERATEQEMLALKSALQAFREAVEGSGVARDLIQTKSAFYDALMAGTGNRALESALRNLHGRVTLLRATSMASPGRIDNSLTELEAIVAAIVARDPAAAQKACEIHVRNASKTVLRVLGQKNWVRRSTEQIDASGDAL